MRAVIPEVLADRGDSGRYLWKEGSTCLAQREESRREEIAGVQEE
jgi:hypothetical protein